MTTFDYFTGRMVEDKPDISKFVASDPYNPHPKGVHEWEYRADIFAYECSICGEPGPYVGRPPQPADPIPATVWVAMVTYTKTQTVQLRNNAAVQPISNGQGVGRLGIFSTVPQVAVEETMAAKIIGVCPTRGFAEIASEAHQRAHPELAQIATWSISEHKVGLPEPEPVAEPTSNYHTCIGPGCDVLLVGQEARCGRCQKAYWDECRAADPRFGEDTP